MWVLAINGLVYLALGLVTGRFRRKLLPIRPREVVADVKAALTFKLAHDDLSVYNAVQRLLYLGVILAGVVIVLSGLAIWKPVQLQELTALFGGYDAARYVHFFCDGGDRRLSRRACAAGAAGAEKPARHGRGTIGVGHAAQAQPSSPASITRLLIKDAAKLMPDPTRRLFLRGGASLGALTLLTGCDIVDGDAAEGVLRKISTFNDGVQALAVQSEQARAELSRERDHAAVPVQRLLPEDEAPEVDGQDYKLEVGGLIDNKEPWTLERALRAAAGVADHAAHLRRGLERDRLMAGRAAVGIPAAASAPTPARNMSGSSAPRAIPTPSTWRRRCIRRRSSRSSSTTRSCRASTASR